jgi:predicted amidophosphoribosyltransferase
MTPEELAAVTPARLRARVGGFFSNTSRGAGFCAVCTAPSAAPGLCGRCGEHRAAYGSQLAEWVVILAYVRGWMTPRHQSEHHVWQYKHRSHPSATCLRDLQLMVLAACVLHGACMAASVGRRWEVVSFVPSVRWPGPEHPVAELARQVAAYSPALHRVRLVPGSQFNAERHILVADRFAVSGADLASVNGRHVVVVDDTWVSGAKAFRASGAAAVTVLCLGRWLSQTWAEHRPLVEAPVVPYDAARCPVTGGACPAPQLG